MITQGGLKERRESRAGQKLMVGYVDMAREGWEKCEKGTVGSG